jgi:hypothetical protein
MSISSSVARQHYVPGVSSSVSFQADIAVENSVECRIH